MILEEKKKKKKAALPRKARVMRLVLYKMQACFTKASTLLLTPLLCPRL